LSEILTYPNRRSTLLTNTGVLATGAPSPSTLGRAGKPWPPSKYSDRLLAPPEVGSRWTRRPHSARICADASAPDGYYLFGTAPYVVTLGLGIATCSPRRTLAGAPGELSINR
jgi:hypothetical protein